MYLRPLLQEENGASKIPGDGENTGEVSPERIGTFRGVDATIGRHLAGVKNKAVHIKGRAGIERMRHQKGDNTVARSAAQPCERDMRREFALFRPKTDTLKCCLDLALEMQDGRVVAHARPKSARIFPAEFAD